MFTLGRAEHEGRRHMSKAYKNYFPLPNVIFSLGLSPGEIAVYSYLLYCEDRRLDLVTSSSSLWSCRW